MNVPEILTESEIMVKAPSVFCYVRGPKTTEKYKHINTYTVLNEFRSFGWDVIAAKQKRVRGLSVDKTIYTQHELTLRPTNLTNVNSEFIPTLRIINSHNTESSLRIYLGVFRLICSNGLVVASSVFANSRLLHKDTIEDKIGKEIARIQAAIPVLNNYVNLMSSVTLTAEQQAQYASDALQLRYPDQSNKKRKIDALNLLFTRRNGDSASDLWTVFNRVQENLLRGGQHGVRRLTSIQRDVELNQELFSKALEYLPKQAA